MVSFLAGMSSLADLGRVKRPKKPRKQRMARKATSACPPGYSLLTGSPSVCMIDTPSASQPGLRCATGYTQQFDSSSSGVIKCKPSDTGGGGAGQTGGDVVLPDVPGKKKKSPLHLIADALREMERQRQRIEDRYQDPGTLRDAIKELRQLVLDIYNISMSLPKNLGDQIREAASGPGRGQAEVWKIYAGLAAEAGWPDHDPTALFHKTLFLRDVVIGLNNAEQQGDEARDKYLMEHAVNATAAMYEYGRMLARTLVDRKLVAKMTPRMTPAMVEVDVPWNQGDPIIKLKPYREELDKDKTLSKTAYLAQQLVNFKPVNIPGKQGDFESVANVQDWTFASVVQNPSADTLAAKASTTGAAASRLTGLGQAVPQKPLKKTTAELVALGAAAGVAVGVATGNKTAGVVAGLTLPMVLILIENKSQGEYDAWFNRVFVQAGKPTGTQA